MKALTLLLFFVFSLVGADSGYMADLGKTLPQGVWRLSGEFRSGSYGVVSPAVGHRIFNADQQAVVGKACYGILAKLEACADVPWQKTSTQSAKGPLGWTVKYSPIYHPYFRGEFIATVSYRGLVQNSQVYPTSDFLPGNRGTATVSYGSSHEAALTLFASKNRIAGQAFGSYQVNLRRDFFRPGNSACGGTTVYFSPQDIKSENKISLAADGWMCLQESSEYGGKPFASQGRVAAVGPAIIFTHGSRFGIKAAVGIWAKKPTGVINYNPERNGDGFSLAMWVRR